MPDTPEHFADTIAIGALSGIIDDALRSLHVTGSLLLRETYSSPWSISIPAAGKLAELLNVDTGVHVVAFHLVEFGHCAIRPKSGDEILLQAGEMAVSFGGEAHRLLQGRTSRSQHIESLLAGGPNIQRPHASFASTDGTALLCGVFLLHHTTFNPLIDALPSLMHTRLSRSGELHNLSGVARLMAEEVDRKSPVGGYVIERLLEVLCAEVVRAHIEAVPPRETGWLRGIKDPVIGRAIAAIHSEPGKAWTVQRMANDVSMSPSRFAARFTESVGDSPMAYTTKWRMNLACRALSGSRQSIDQIAATVGYDSPAAFSRAFKKHLGVSPALWRSRD